jgi:hypothetical protein
VITSIDGSDTSGGGLSGERRMVRGIVKRVLAVLVLLAAAPHDVRADPAGPAAVVFDADVPGDVRALARTTWERFVSAFPARVECLPPVIVVATRELEHRAGYDPGRQVVRIRIPGTAPNLSASLIHEFAHHLEFTCPEHRTLRGPFLAAQGLPPNASWFEGPSWEQVPSEQFAEAVVEAVLGERHAHARIPISDAAILAIRTWGGK